MRDLPHRIDSLRTEVILPPVFLLASYGILQLGFVEAAATLLVTVPFHELGHASMAWLGSRWAFPVGAIIPMAAFTWVVPGRSVVLFLLLAATGSWVAWRLLKAGFREAGAACLILLFALYQWTWNRTETQWEHAFVYGGIGGEIGLSAWAIVAFHIRLPDRLRWDFFRIPVLALGSYCFAHALWFWSGVVSGARALPVGSFLDGRDDAGGDLQRLMASHGWSQAAIGAHFSRLAWGTGAVLIAHYLWRILVRPKEDAARAADQE